MNQKGCSSVPRELFYLITFLSKALPQRAVGTFIELLMGAMLTSTEIITAASARLWGWNYRATLHFADKIGLFAVCTKKRHTCCSAKTLFCCYEL